MQRCLEKATVRLFAALSAECCNPYDIYLEPMFSGDDAETSEEAKRVAKVSSDISWGVGTIHDFEFLPIT